MQEKLKKGSLLQILCSIYGPTMNHCLQKSFVKHQLIMNTDNHLQCPCQICMKISISALCLLSSLKEMKIITIRP